MRLSPPRHSVGKDDTTSTHQEPGIKESITTHQCNTAAPTLVPAWSGRRSVVPLSVSIDGLHSLRPRRKAAGVDREVARVVSEFDTERKSGKNGGSIAARPFQVSLEEGRHGKSSLTLLPEWQEVSKERIFAASISTLGRCREEETDSTEVPWARWAEGETPRVKAAKAHEGRKGRDAGPDCFISIAEGACSLPGEESAPQHLQFPSPWKSACPGRPTPRLPVRLGTTRGNLPVL